MTEAPTLSIVERLPQAVASREAVAVLEEYLEHAKAGHITAVAIAATTTTDSALTVITRSENAILLLGAVHRLAVRLNQGLDGAEVPDGGGAA